ncbi:hypothetical protein M408DRAFT_329016 [Serendipita vermifera MAFF 305830]|uniref:ribonuclease Z n=1 Tax=Serendipita vermifera MAFF 305830 TaxID=933852 RepID=A0A0C2XIS2_SERVB|nr:hypothetical protein M408DRAFT_329016 [Serendipita vermifera MAFF 305830]
MSKNPEPWKARVVSSVTSDSDSAFQISFGDAKYLFNCPENTTRAMLSRKFGFNKYKAIFLSRISNETSGGLPGFLMTLADSGTSDLTVHGPPGLLHFLASARSYLLRDRLKLEASETDTEAPGPIYKDQNVSIYAIPVNPSASNQLINPAPEPGSPSSLKRKHADVYDGAPARKRSSSERASQNGSPQRSQTLIRDDPDAWRKLVVARMFPGTHGITFHSGIDYTVRELRQPLPSWTSRPFATSYLVVGPEFRGKFDAALANSLGVPNGPARRKLTLGENVTLPNGQIITPSMVIGKTTPSASVLVVDCPDPRYIDGLISSTYLKDLLSRQPQHLHCVFHMASQQTMSDPRYVEWMSSLGETVHHIVSNSSVCADEITYPAAEALQKRLSTLDQDIFRVPASKSEAEQSLPSLPPVLKVVTSRRQVIGMRPLLEPENEVILNQFEGDEMLAAVEDRSFKGIKEKVMAELAPSVVQPGDDVSVTCLGTGSAMPGKYRNVSGLLLQIPGSGNVLMDAGEGTWGQLRRNFGDKCDQVLRETKCVFLSHIHGDHHMGISRILAHRRKLSPPPTEPVYLVCTRGTWSYLKEYNELEDLGLDEPSGVRAIFCESLEHRQSPPNAQTMNNVKELCASLQLESVKTAEVVHRTKAFGLILRHSNGWSLTYSGDTKPCQNLVVAGMESTILIHEATMADDQVEMAEEKAHSTIGQAVDIAKRMKVQKLLLTHFSARYPKIPVLGTHGSQLASRSEITIMPEVFIAFDFLNIRLGDFARVERYLPNLEAAFSELQDDVVTTLEQ